MSRSSADPFYRPMLPPYTWNPFAPAYGQILLALGLAGAFWLGAFLVLPTTTAFVIKCFSTFLHEIGHGLIAWLGQSKIEEIVVRADGHGHAIVATSGPIHSVLTSAAGLVFPAWLSAALFAAAITRTGIDVLMYLLAIVLATMGYFFLVADHDVMLALSSVIVVTALAGFLPAGGTFKATVTFILAFAVTKGVLDGLDYAFVDWINGDKTQPSDAQSISTRLGITDIKEVSIALVSLIGGGYAVALITAWNWLQRRR